MIDNNLDPSVARGFGQEWSTFRQDAVSLDESQRREIFDDYFRIFPWSLLPEGGGVGADIGCGTGRWSLLVAPRVEKLHLVDASADALKVAEQNLCGIDNVSFHRASVADMPFAQSSLDFAYSLGVLHHVPDTKAAIAAIADKLKPGAPFLVYLYYALDNRPAWYRLLWRVSNVARLAISRLPHPLRLAVSQVIAVLVYWPMAQLARCIAPARRRTLPLAYYADKSFYVMRTDAYDRFCTRLEKRFSREEIERMLTQAGFVDLRFSDREPFWCAVGIKSGA
jgi:ubiquinone/menaquinone biosynthesis C-methylase UbiE